MMTEVDAFPVKVIFLVIQRNKPLNITLNKLITMWSYIHNGGNCSKVKNFLYMI